jgi:hypothetical protein
MLRGGAGGDVAIFGDEERAEFTGTTGFGESVSGALRDDDPAGDGEGVHDRRAPVAVPPPMLAASEAVELTTPARTSREILPEVSVEQEPGTAQDPSEQAFKLNCRSDNRRREFSGEQLIVSYCKRAIVAFYSKIEPPTETFTFYENGLKFQSDYIREITIFRNQHNSK